jgi:hypothetical protein
VQCKAGLRVEWQGEMSRLKSQGGKRETPTRGAGKKKNKATYLPTYLPRLPKPPT